MLNIKSPQYRPGLLVFEWQKSESEWSGLLIINIIILLSPKKGKERKLAVGKSKEGQLKNLELAHHITE